METEGLPIGLVAKLGDCHIATLNTLIEYSTVVGDDVMCHTLENIKKWLVCGDDIYFHNNNTEDEANR